MTLSKLCCSFFEFFQEHENVISILIDNNMANLLEQEFAHYLPKIELLKKSMTLKHILTTLYAIWQVH